MKQNINESTPITEKKNGNPIFTACPEKIPPMVHPMPVATLYFPRARPLDSGKYSVMMAGINIYEE